VTFATQRECKLLNKIIECVEGMDAEAMTMAIREYNNITPLDEWKTTLLLRVKNAIVRAGGGGGETGDGVEDMT
jgi:alpha-soluble NSF attachment protein